MAMKPTNKKSLLTRLRLWWKYRRGIPVYSYGRQRGYIKVNTKTKS